MRVSDIVLLLGLAAQFDGRIEVDQLKAEAWQLALSAHIPYEFARDAIPKHYAESKEVIAPVHINGAWRLHNKSQYELTKSASHRLELEQSDSKKATPEFVANIMQEIRATLNEKRVQENESNQPTD